MIEYFALFYLYVNEVEKYGFSRKKKTNNMLYCFLRKRERNHQLRTKNRKTDELLDCKEKK